jgi:hypothetical protein
VEPHAREDLGSNVCFIASLACFRVFVLLLSLILPVSNCLKATKLVV